MKLEQLAKIKKYEQFVLRITNNFYFKHVRYRKDILDIDIKDNKIIFDGVIDMNQFSQITLIEAFLYLVKDSKLVQFNGYRMTFEVPADPVKKTFKVEYADPSDVFIRYIAAEDLQDAKDFLRDSLDEKYGWRPEVDTMEQESFIDKDGDELFTISYDTQDWETEEDSIND
jgi:hypothetical protein